MRKKSKKGTKSSTKSNKGAKADKPPKPPKKKTEEDLVEEIEEIKEKEEKLLKKVTYEINKDKIKSRKIFFEVEHFSFNDFSQILIGCCVFGLPAFINTSFWDYLGKNPVGEYIVGTQLLFLIHMFFILCVILALNYEFRDNFAPNPWFFKMLMKRFFFTYFSVFMVIILLLSLVNKMNYGLVNLEIFRNFLAAQSVGMFGAVTFSFLKK